MDDFFDVGSTNLLGGDSNVDRHSATAAATYEDGALCVTYDITETGGYAVYYSPLERLDVTSYRSLYFGVKGATSRLLSGVRAAERIFTSCW